MRSLFTFVFASLLAGCAIVDAAAQVPELKNGNDGMKGIRGSVQVSKPLGLLSSSSIHFVATATTSCPKGIAAMGIYSAPHTLVYSVQGATIDTYIKLPPGTYSTVVQEWDKCQHSAKTVVPLTVQEATTTLALQTANNTSAADTFNSLTNGDTGAGNVSKVDLHTLLYPGATTQIYAELQPWFGDRRHMSVGYTSWDPIEVEKQLVDMQSRGVAGVVIDWYGPSDRTEPTTLAWLAAAASYPNFKIIIMIDKGAVDLSPCKGCNPQQSMIYLTNYVLQHYANQPSYATLDGKPIITQFDLDRHFTLDWAAIQAATSPNVAWIFEHSEGFSHAISGGSWSWVNATSTTYGMTYLTKFYDAAMRLPGQQSWGAAYKGFNDTLASWSLKRVLGQQCGQTWLQTFSKISTYYNSGKQLPILQLVTWNDYEEGTEMESGIDNCLTVSTSVTGSMLNWKVNGNENTVDHYVVYFSADGASLLQLNTLPVGTSSMDLSPFNLTAGTMYVQAVGKPSMKNQMSAPALLAGN
jgi:hypothetical protein